MNKTTILIVEDEAIVAADLAGKLKQLGYDVVGTVAEGGAAVELACNLQPQVVLMDIWLKGPMDGIEAAEAIRSRHCAPVIYLTAHSDSATLERAKLSEPFGYILKPFEERELATAIEMALYKHQSDLKLRKANEELEQRVEERTQELKELNDTLEERITERTAQLNAANETLRASRVAALNLMEDSVVARREAEEMSAKLQFEIEERKRAEEERQTSVEFLQLVNESQNSTDLIRGATTFFREKSGCEAVGIRLKEGDDYPYVENHGFSEVFVLLENHLCEYNENGELICDSAGDPVIECMCGNVICGRFDPSKPFFTSNGSFWSNCTTELLASTTEADRQARTRNRCNGEGYESVALIPLSIGEQRLGLLQLNDHQRGRFTPATIALFERLSGYLSVALTKFRAEEALRDNEEKLGLFIEYAPAGLAMFDREMRYIHASQRWRNDYKMGDRELRGVYHYEIFPEISKEWKEAHRRGLAGEVLRSEADRFERIDGSMQWVRWEIRPWQDSSGDVGGIVIFAEDITESKQAEEALLLAKAAAEAATQAKSQFLANMSHELRTPMTGVLGMLEIAQSGPLDEKQRDAIDTACRSGRSLIRIINDILDLTKAESGKLVIEDKPFDLADCVAGAVDILIPEARRKGLDLVWSIADSLPRTVNGDRIRLQQVLTNLTGNAVKFTERGKVEVIVTSGKNPLEGKGEIIFTVTDTGIGIPDNMKELIFGSFNQADVSHTRRFGGTGLGLSISKEILYKMGGTLSFESTEGKGSSFTFTIPLCEAEPEIEAETISVTATPAENKVTQSDERKVRILIAEDDEVTRKILGFMLQQFKYDLHFATDGLKAVEMWENGDYDLIIMDGQMPGMDGFAATGVIRDRERERGGHIPIVAMTAHALREDKDRCLAAGMDVYVSKPIDFRKCIEVIQGLLGRDRRPEIGDYSP